MANILTGIIKLEAPGVEQVTNKVAGSVQRLQSSMRAASPVTQQFNQLLREAPNFALSAQIGILSLSNNLPYFTEAIQKARASGQGFGSILKQMGSGLLSITGLATIAVTAFVAFGQTLLGNKAKAEEDKAALDALGDSIDDVKRSTEGLTSALQFQNQLGAINVKILGLGDLEDLRQQSIAQQNIVFELQQKTLQAQQNRAEASRKVSEKASDDNIALEKRAIDGVRQAQEEEERARDKGRIIYRQIESQKITDRQKATEDAKKLYDKDQANYEKYVNDTISRAKELAAFFKEGFEVPQFTIFQSKDEQFRIAKQFVDGFKRTIIDAQGQMRQIAATAPPIDFKQRINLSWEIPEGPNQGFKDHLNSIQQDIPKIAQTVDISANLKGFEDAQKKMNKLKQGFIDTGQAIGSFIVPAIDQMIEAIGRGENAFAAFGQAVKQILQAVIAKLIETAILSAIISAISGGTSNAANGGMSFLDAFKNIFGGFRAGGGPVQAGRAYVVGENRPELFVPNVSGSIIPDIGGARGGFSGFGGMQLQATVRGSDLVFVLAQANGSLGRLT